MEIESAVICMNATTVPDFRSRPYSALRPKSYLTYHAWVFVPLVRKEALKVSIVTAVYYEGHKPCSALLPLRAGAGKVRGCLFRFGLP